MPGMDPMQKKMMQFMPLVFGVMMAFFPAGLVLYWVTNGALGLLQQWCMTAQVRRDAKPATPVARGLIALAASLARWPPPTPTPSPPSPPPPAPAASASSALSGPARRAIAAGAVRGARCGRATRTTCASTTPTASRIDDGIALWFAAPHSYTGEDVVELQAHGSPVLLAALLRRCLRTRRAAGARPGEFTERAFLEGKLDLAQAEAVADLIARRQRRRRARRPPFARRRVLAPRRGADRRAARRCASMSRPAIDFPDEDIDCARRRRRCSARLADVRAALARRCAPTPNAAGACATACTR